MPRWDENGNLIQEDQPRRRVRRWDENGNEITEGRARASARDRDFRAPRGAPGTPLRALEDFNREGLGGMVSQAWRQVPFADEATGLLARGGQALENTMRRARGQPVQITPEEASLGARDYQRSELERYARENPGGNAGATAMNVIGLAGAPALTGPISALRAGAVAAGIDAPFALARQEGTLQERLPGAAQEVATVGAFGAGLQGLANRLAPTAVRPNSAQARLADFEAAGVRPTMAAVSGGATAGATKLIAENFIAGIPARARLQASIDDTAQAARNLAARYGQHGQPEQVGEHVQSGIRRFIGNPNDPMPNIQRPNRAGVMGRASARSVPVAQWSLRAKSRALYDEVFSNIAREEQALIQGGTGVRATARRTRQALAAMQNEPVSPAVSELVSDPLVGRIREALDADAGNLTFQTLRRLRTWVREAQDPLRLGQNTDQAALARLESALTEDIYRSAEVIGGPSAAQDIRTIDRWYRRLTTRRDQVLQPFMDRSGRGAYERIIDMARKGRSQNSQALRQLRASLRDDEWREVSATIIDNLGNPNPGNPTALEPGSFSIDTFHRNYATLSDEGRRVLFNGGTRHSLMEALDTLARVAGYQKGVEALANRSRSGVNLQNAATFGGLSGMATPAGVGATVATLAGMTITGEMLTNPAFVRWLASAPKAGAGVGGMRRQLAALAQIAARDPAIAPFYTDLVQRAESQFRAPQDQQLERTSGIQ